MIVQEQHGEFPKGLARISELLGLSHARLGRLFKLTIGKTLVQYLREERMTRSAHLVNEHNLSIKEIAKRCGYDDVSNFYRDFRKAYKMTPKEMRMRQFELLCESKEPPAHAPKHL
jgi:AraC-like DNA-binding protein